LEGLGLALWRSARCGCGMMIYHARSWRGPGKGVLPVSKVFSIATTKLMGAGRILPDSSWHMATHLHPDQWEFIYFLKGCGRVETPTSTFFPQRYHLVVYPPGLPHAEWASAHDPEETVFITVSVQGQCPQGVHLLLPDRDGKLRWLATNILEEFHAFGPSSLLAQTYTQALLLIVERYWTEASPVPHDVVDVVIQYIQTNYSRPLSIRRLAKTAHISPSYLAHRFREKTGISLMRYVQKVRIEEATRLLSTTDHAISAIARQVGFTDPLHFSRVFKKMKGFSPTEMRLDINRLT